MYFDLVIWFYLRLNLILFLSLNFFLLLIVYFGSFGFLFKFDSFELLGDWGIFICVFMVLYVVVFLVILVLLFSFINELFDEILFLVK